MTTGRGRARREVPALKLAIVPLTPERWVALEDLFGDQGACGGCWCMYWRIGARYRTRPRAENKAAFHAVVATGPPPGLLALHGEVAVGWCQLTPRQAVPWLERACDSGARTMCRSGRSPASTSARATAGAA